MRRAVIIVLGIPLALAALAMGIRLYHLGPLGIRPGDYILLAHLSLKNGPDFFAIGRRTESIAEPYEVTLYKAEPDHKTSMYYLAFEDSYWWNCSIRSNKTSAEIEIRADGEVVARYLPTNDVVVSDAYKVLQPAHSIHYWQLEEILAKSKR